MPQLFYRSGGSFVEAKKLYYRVSGTWQQVKNAWYRSGGVWTQIYRAFALTTANGKLTRVVATPTSVTLTVTFNSDGTITPNYPAGYSGPSNWGSPTTTGIGANYWIRVDVTSGTMGTGTTGTWLAMSSAQTFGRTATSGYDIFFRVRFATDSAGTNVVSDVFGWEILRDVP